MERLTPGGKIIMNTNKIGRERPRYESEAASRDVGNETFVISGAGQRSYPLYGKNSHLIGGGGKRSHGRIFLLVVEGYS